MRFGLLNLKKAIKGDIQARLSAVGVHASAGRGATTPPDGADSVAGASESQRHRSGVSSDTIGLWPRPSDAPDSYK